MLRLLLFKEGRFPVVQRLHPEAVASVFVAVVVAEVVVVVVVVADVEVVYEGLFPAVHRLHHEAVGCCCCYSC